MTEKRERVAYLTPPLPDDLQVTGSPRITFYAAMDREDTNFRIEVHEEGSWTALPLACGWLKASHRTVDESKTTPWEIIHDHTKAIPVKPGEINKYTVQLRPLSHLFRAGKRIKLEISSIDVPTDPQTYDVMWHALHCRTTVHSDLPRQRTPIVPGASSRATGVARTTRLSPQAARDAY